MGSGQAVAEPRAKATDVRRWLDQQFEEAHDAIAVSAGIFLHHDEMVLEHPDYGNSAMDDAHAMVYIAWQETQRILKDCLAELPEWRMCVRHKAAARVFAAAEKRLEHVHPELIEFDQDEMAVTAGMEIASLLAAIRAAMKMGGSRRELMVKGYEAGVLEA